QVDETRARVLLAEGRTVEAEKTARRAVRTLEKGDELSLLAEALVTHGVALARLDHPEQAREEMQRAVDVAEQAGDFQSAGMAALTLIEHLGANLSDEEIEAAIDRVGVLLDETRDMSTLRKVMNGFRVTFAVPGPLDWTGFSFKKAVHRYEAHLIGLALKETGGLVTQAARLLGFKHHQSLVSLINGRHKDLLERRSAVRKRRHHLMVHPNREAKRFARIRNPKSRFFKLRTTRRSPAWSEIVKREHFVEPEKATIAENGQVRHTVVLPGMDSECSCPRGRRFA